MSEQFALVTTQLFSIFQQNPIKLFVNPNNDIRFTADNWQLNIERSKFACV